MEGLSNIIKIYVIYGWPLIQIAEIQTIEEDELHEIEEHHAPTSPTLTTTDDKENDAQV